MYSHPLLDHWADGRRKRLLSKKKVREPRELEPRRRTLDEKLDQALEFTFPASDAFVVS
jgi:hypothetical protein